MPVSPQDFELYSRVTGAPMPTDAMSRMQMAPEVFQFTRNFARKPNLLEKTGNLVKTVGKIGLMGLGEGYRQSQANEQRAIQESLRNSADKAESESVTMDDPIEEVKDTPAMAKIRLQMKADEIKHQNKLEIEDRRDERARLSGKVQEPTTADNYGLDRVQNQTARAVINKKMDQGSQISDRTPNVAEVLSESQDSAPVDESFPIGDARRNMRSVEEIEKNLQEDMETAGLTRIGGPEGGVGKSQLQKFLTKKGLDKALLGAISERMTPQPRIGDDSPLVDHPDLPGGEDDINLPSGTNTSPTEDLSSFYKEMRKMDALERMAEQSPSTKQIALNEMNKSREGFMAQDGPNKPAYDAKQRIGQRAKDQMLAQMKKNEEDEERIKKLNLNQDRPTTTTPEQKENFKKLVAAQELQKVFPESQDRNLLDPLGVLNDPKFMSAVRQGQNKARLESNLISDRVDDFTAKFVEGAKSDIVRGARGNKSLGITRIPATNGDAQVGFVLANKPLDQSPTTATTYGFGVAPGAESLLDNQLNKDSFSDYMQRGMMEAKKGIKRKAGEIFEFLPKSRRVVQGTASLGDIVM
mgnify:CR=1 FL=1